jgi:hypothetical protein
MKHATSLALHGYWQKRQRSDGVRAKVIDAAELAPILNSVFLLATDARGEPAFTFCGADIAARYGRDLCHEGFLDLWGGTDREVIADHIRTLSADRNGLVAGIIAETFGGGFTCFEILLLPLSGGSGTAGLLGSMARVGGHEENNRMRARIVGQSLRSSRFVPATKREFRLEGAGLVSRAPGGETPRRYGHLTVLPGGKPFGRHDAPEPLTEL